MREIKIVKEYKAAPNEVFEYLDDLGVTGMHMTKSSMTMMSTGGSIPRKMVQRYGYGWQKDLLTENAHASSNSQVLCMITAGGSILFPVSMKNVTSMKNTCSTQRL